MYYVFKHKEDDKYGQWVFDIIGKWKWVCSDNFPLLHFDLPRGIDVKSACLSTGPQSLRGIEVAEEVAKDYTLEIWEE